MLETLTRGFTAARERLAGIRELDEGAIDEALGSVRRSLLEADVDYGVVKDFLARVRERALGEKVRTRVRDARGRVHRITPDQHFVRICQQELEALMGPVDTSLGRAAGAVSVMLVGLQGVGKTTVAAKLARHLESQGRRPLLVAADVYRPAAVEQLVTLGERIGVPVHVGRPGQLPPEICEEARDRVRGSDRNAVIYDTAGRLAVDEELMRELEEIQRRVAPANTLLVCDALMGRDAVNVAREFSGRLDLDGLVLTKLDGDARGGAALAVKAVTGVPIKFLGTGEALDRLEPFRPDGLASRILGMGDIVGLVQDFEQVVDEKEAEEDAERLLQGRFGLDDMLKQLKTIQKMGPLKEIFARLPGMGALAEQVEEEQIRRVEALIYSMTPEERRRPEVIDRSRGTRIARGSGRKYSEVRELIQRFSQMREMMASLGRGGFGRLAGAGPGGVDPAALLGGGGGGRRAQPARNRSQQKRKRKQARRDRKRSRRR